MQNLTARQQQILEVVTAEIQAGHGFPTIRSLAQRMGFASPKAAADHLKALAKKGYLQRCPTQRSGYKISEDILPDTQSFLYATGLAAGSPKEAFDAPDAERIQFDPTFFGSGQQIAVSISGDSMTGDGIHDGDIAIIKLQKSFHKNDIVAVRIGTDETTLKRLALRGKKTDLLSSNPKHPIRSVPSDQIEIIGKLSGVVRRT